MDKEELISQVSERYDEFMNWVRRNVITGEAYRILSARLQPWGVCTFFEFYGSNSVDELWDSYAKTWRWMNVIYEQFDQFESTEEFQQWVISNEFIFDEFMINDDRSIKLNEMLKD